MFDNVSKFLAERYSADFATWLLGRKIALTTLNPTELNVEPIRADSAAVLFGGSLRIKKTDKTVVLLSSAEMILHTEFQTEPDKDMPLRMADYYIRLRRPKALALTPPSPPALAPLSQTWERGWG